jgi:hypothetical protein
METIERDRDLIEKLGGATKVAELLNLEKLGGVQRVHNWKSRGIPAAVKVARPDLFMSGVDYARPVVATSGT